MISKEKQYEAMMRVAGAIAAAYVPSPSRCSWPEVIERAVQVAAEVNQLVLKNLDKDTKDPYAGR